MRDGITYKDIHMVTFRLDKSGKSHWVARHFEIEGLWQPKFLVDRSDSFSTYGSCFAQRFSAQLLANDFDWVNTERPPTGMSKSTAQKFNYGIYSSRTQNIYLQPCFSSGLVGHLINLKS